MSNEERYSTQYQTTYKPEWMDWDQYWKLAEGKNLSRDERGLRNSITCAPRNAKILKPWEEGRS